MFNMFRAVRRSSSGALTVFAASGLHTQVVTRRSQVWVGTGLGIVPVVIDQVVGDARDYVISNNRYDT
jgi:hypothetical protein